MKGGKGGRTRELLEVKFAAAGGTVDVEEVNKGFGGGGGLQK